jgi:MFS family permease
MLIPSQIILTFVRPSYWLSSLEIIWGILTGLIATTHNANQVYALRFFLGLCESSAWPGMMTLFSKMEIFLKSRHSANQLQCTGIRLLSWQREWDFITAVRRWVP